MALCARFSFVDATIFIVLVIFSMFRIDLRRPSISRRVANVAALRATGLVGKSAEAGCGQEGKFIEWGDGDGNLPN